MDPNTKHETTIAKWKVLLQRAGEYYVRGLLISIIFVFLWYVINKLMHYLKGLEAEPQHYGMALLVILLLPFLLGWFQYRFLRSRLTRMRSGRAIGRMEDKLIAELSLDERRGYPVVLVDYPNKEVRSLGLMTATVVGATPDSEYGVVFVPKGPGNGIRGQLLTVNVKDLEYTDWNLQALLQCLLTYGGSTPGHFNHQVVDNE
jgi:uncharacterized membrane protein